MGLNNDMLRRASDTKAISKRGRSKSVFHKSLNFKSEALVNQISASTHDDVWLGPEEVIRGRRLTAGDAGFLCPHDTLRLSIKNVKRKHFWQKNQLDVIESESSKPFAGGARIRHNPSGFDLIDKAGKVAVKCFEQVNVKTQQSNFIICSTQWLTANDEPFCETPFFYRWFKVSLDDTRSECTLDLWSGSDYYPLWYAEKINLGNDVTFKTVADDEYVGKLSENELSSFACADPALMICLLVSLQRLTSQIPEESQAK